MEGILLRQGDEKREAEGEQVEEQQQNQGHGEKEELELEDDVLKKGVVENIP